VADCSLVIATSARSRTLEWPALTPHELAVKISGMADGAQVAVVFGREHSGLTNEELQHCHYSVTIPTNPDFSSLNVASSIQVISYEIYNRMQDSSVLQPTRLSRSDSPADSEQMEGFFNHLEQVLVDINFLDAGNPRQIMKRLRRLYLRAEPTCNEINILRGMLSAVAKSRA
jgi:TrmH family RNA methyltransferase